MNKNHMLKHSHKSILFDSKGSFTIKKIMKNEIFFNFMITYSKFDDCK